MKHIYKALFQSTSLWTCLSITFLFGLGGCSSLTNMASLEQMITRTEKDIYTITKRDTAIIDAVRNAPGQRDNGIVYPTSRIVEMRRDISQIDSTTVREYPNFIRLALFESVGLLFSGKQDNGISGGFLGIFGYFDEDYKKQKNMPKKGLFPGAFYRIGIMEKRLRWFDDAADWTLGTSIYESFSGDMDASNTFTGVSPIYLRKRYFIREKIPYITITPSLGISLIPDQYINAGVSADIGSLGGLNFRSYLGIIAGLGSKNACPYFGIGTSVLDFLNRVPETEKEWKYQEHSSWSIGIASIIGVATNAEYPFFDPKTNSPFKGIIGRIAPASIAIPLGNNRFYAGTSLINFMLLGQTEGGIGILPLRLGYVHTLMGQELSLEPFAEYNYYPSSMVHIGTRLALRISNQINLQLQAGYSTGSPIATLNRDFKNLTNFDIFYIGIGIGLYDRLFQSSELRYRKSK